MKKFIFFRNDRLGDFIIITNLIKAIKLKYPNSQIIILCSPYNYRFIKKYKIIDKIVLYDRKYPIIKKINIFFNIVKFNYFAAFAIDGKTFSYLCNFFLNSKYKLGLVYRYYLFGLMFFKPNYLYNKFIFNKFETFTSKSHLKKIEHLPSKFINLGNYLNLNINTKDKYFYPLTKKNEIKFKEIFNYKIKSKYILLHFDEKWLDIKNIDTDLASFVLNMQILTKKKIVITSYKNNYKYYVNFKKRLKIIKNNKILLFENINLEIMERLIKYSFFSISCHSGFLVQIAGSNHANLIDIINNFDLKWYSCWKPKNTLHKFVFKSHKKQISLKNILKKILLIIRKF